MSTNISFLNRHECFQVDKESFYADLLPIIDCLFPHVSYSYDVKSFYGLHKKLIKSNPSDFNTLAEEFFSQTIKTYDTPNNYGDVTIFVNIIKRIVSKCGLITIGAEYNYIDKDFRDSYYIHYSEKHKEVQRYCTRIVFFAGDCYDDLTVKVKYSEEEHRALQNNLIGQMIITPLIGRSIGRTLMNPYYFFEKGSAFVRTSEYSIYYKCHHFTIKAFPFRMQDRITTSCAEVTVVNIVDYYSKSYSDYAYMAPSDIHLIAKQERYERHIPTGGLSYEFISRLLYRAGLAPKFYHPSKIGNCSMHHLISYYVESGIPVAIGTSPDFVKAKEGGHSIICVGHGKCNYQLNLVAYEETPQIHCKYINAADLSTELIVQDDCSAPYSVYEQLGIAEIQRKKEDTSPFDNSEMYKIRNIDCMVAPLYKRMYMDAIKAEDTIKTILDHNLFSPIEYSEDKPIIFRLFIASSRHLKAFRVSTIDNLTICRLYQEVPLPQFIWVCELFSIKGYSEQKAFGEIILDTTYCGPLNTRSCLMINYPTKHLAQFFDEGSLFVEDDPSEDSVQPFASHDWVEFKGIKEFDAYSNFRSKKFSSIFEC